MKKILPFILAVTVLAGCTAKEGTKITLANETGGASDTVTTAEKTETTTVTTETTTVTTETTTVTTETATEITTEAIDTSSVDYIKEALKADWNNSVTAADLYAADLNGDGVKELFARYLFGAMKDGFLYVYDVSDGVKKLYEISARSSMGSNLYTDENGVVHYIFWSDYAGSIWEENYAYFDITYDSIKIPFYVDVHGWFDGGAHVFDDNIYKNCEFVPTNDRLRNFDSEKAELVGTFEYKDILAAFEDGESNEVSEIIQKEVFEGMTYFSDSTHIYFGSSYTDDFEDFDGFWNGAAPALAEIYGDTVSEN